MEIKLKAWHKTELKICDVSALSIGIGAFLIGVNPGKDEMYGDRMVVKAPEDGRFCPLEDIELLLATGMKDKNNIEIHEGHILKIGAYKIGDIIFKNVAFYFHQISENGTWYNILSLYQDAGAEIEVIGNIFENQNLLK